MTVSALEARLSQVEGEQRAALANLQAQFDILAAAHAAEIERNTFLTIEIVALKRKIDPRVPADIEQFARVELPTENAPRRRHFDSHGLLAAMAERQTA